MDPDLLICRRLSLTIERRGASPGERRAQQQFIRDYPRSIGALRGGVAASNAARAALRTIRGAQ